ncbi:hypothetical protein [Marinoscillum pacificum]|uniref:hypothetical protein n=1 Tax=Marinoscillum pacificum TaxID=392723 RepID=UPI0021583073|nr:hypothetical protein [Marinoscillum pacificum]
MINYHTSIAILILIILFISCDSIKNKNTTTTVTDTIEHNPNRQNTDSLIYVSETNISNQKWTNFISRSAKRNTIILNVKGVDAHKLMYSFEQYDPNGELVEKYTGYAQSKPRSYTSINVRFETRARAIYFIDESTNNSNASGTPPYLHSISLRIEKDSSRFASFIYQIRGNRYRFDNLMTPNAMEPYSKYIKPLIMPIYESKRSYQYFIGQGDTANAVNHHKKYQDLLDNMNKALELTSQHVDTNYDFKHDTTLTDLASFYQLDSVINLFQSYNMIFRSNSLVSKPQVIPKELNENLIAIVRFDKDGNILNKYFEKIEGMKEFERFKEPIGSNPFMIRNNSFHTFDNKVIGIMSHLYGFENIQHLFSIWEDQGDSLELVTILDKTISIGIGGVNLDTMITTSTGRILLIGDKAGGDAGDTWGAFWIAELTKPNHLKVIFQSNFEGNTDYMEAINHYFINDSTLALDRVERNWTNEGYQDSVLSTTKVNLLTLPYELKTEENEYMY